MFSSIILSLVVIEGSLRMLVHEEYDYPKGLYSADEHRGYWLSPNFQGIHRQINGDFRVTYSTDGRGYRRSLGNYSLDEIHTAFLGDSFIFGVGVEDAQTVSSQFDVLSGWPTLNAGISGYDLPSSLRAFEYLLNEGAKPRLVIQAFYLGNDFLAPDAVPAYQQITARYGYTVSRKALDAQGEVRFERWLRRKYRTYGFLASRTSSWIGGAFLERVGDAAETGITSSQSWLAEVRLEQNLGTLKTLVDQVQARLIVLIIPTKVQVEPEYRQEVRRDLPACLDDQELGRSARVVRQTCENLGIQFVDLYPILRACNQDSANRSYFRHNPHWTRLGHQIAAQELIKLVHPGP
jgi:GDSL-like lipase/acylhydrolase family protein